MSRFTRDQRQQIVRDFAERNGGWFDPAAFVAEVRRDGDGHVAWSWFEWDDDKAAHEFRLDQARDFARGLIVRFEVQTVHRGAIRVVETSMPFLQSPLEKRRAGGGYYMNDPNDPGHMNELCKQAAQSLRWFLSRYHAAIVHAGGAVQVLEKMQDALEHVGHPHEEAA